MPYLSATLQVIDFIYKTAEAYMEVFLPRLLLFYRLLGIYDINSPSIREK